MRDRIGNARIALDGPSALMLYRERCERDLSQKPWYAAPVHAAATTNIEAVTKEFDGEDFWLSDEDVALTMADSHVFGGLSRNANGDSHFLDDEDSGLKSLKRTRISSFEHCVSSMRAIRKMDLGQVPINTISEESPLFLLVADATQRTRARGVRIRVCSNRFPAGALRKTGNNVLVPTPEFTFLLLAQHLTMVELVMVGMELCGYYRLAGSTTNGLLVSSRTLYGQRPLTTIARIQAFLLRVEGFPGLSKAQRACKHLSQGSASPMETAIYLLLCLSRRLGGYGLARPVLNGKRAVNTDARKLTFADVLIPDLYWSDAKLDIEYDSEAFHASAESLRNGALRTLALRAMHVEVISLTKEVVRDAEAFEVIARLIAKRLGVRRTNYPTSFYVRRDELREAVLRRGNPD